MAAAVVAWHYVVVLIRSTKVLGTRNDKSALPQRVGVAQTIETKMRVAGTT